MHTDRPQRPLSPWYRIARLRAALELCDVFLSLGTFTEADQQALKKRVARALEEDQAEDDPSPVT